MNCHYCVVSFAPGEFQNDFGLTNVVRTSSDTGDQCVPAHLFSHFIKVVFQLLFFFDKFELIMSACHPALSSTKAPWWTQQLHQMRRKSWFRLSRRAGLLLHLLRFLPPPPRSSPRRLSPLDNRLSLLPWCLTTPNRTASLPSRNRAAWTPWRYCRSGSIGMHPVGLPLSVKCHSWGQIQGVQKHFSDSSWWNKLLFSQSL